MKGPKYIETNLQTLIARKQDYTRHIQSIKQAHCDPKLQSKAIVQQISFLKQLQTDRQARFIKKEQEKYSNICKENTKILFKMAAIREEYSQSKDGLRHRTSSAKSTQSNKSLSTNAQKLRNREVSLENQRLKYKIERVQASMPYLESLKEYQKHKQVKERLIRNSSLKQGKIKGILEQIVPNKFLTVRSNIHHRTNRNLLQEKSERVSSLNSLRIGGFSTQR